jgi:TetR/AcrR family transcriptional regulator, mexJK operon transcriptional repressor
MSIPSVSQAAEIGVAQPQRGRPRDPAKHAAILDAARTLFTEQAYDRVTMDAVAARAGVSKVTVYAHFASKDQLFVEALARGCDTLFGQTVLELEAGLPLERTLADFAVGFVRMIRTPDIAALHQVMVSEAHRHPELSQSFYALVVDRGTRLVADVIEAHAARGEIVCDDAYLAARQFIAMAQGDFVYRDQLGLDMGSAEELMSYAAAAARMFVRGHRPGLAPAG